MSSEPYRNDGRSQFWILTLVIFVILDLWLLNFVLGLNPGLLGDRGTLGDVFGVSNSLFSGMALAGVIYAIVLQRTEIGIAKQELSRTKLIFEEQSQMLQLQNAETKKQIFESTFFQLLRLFSDIVENLDLTVGTDKKRGKDVISEFENQLNKTEKAVQRQGQTVNHQNVYERLYQNAQNDLGHYFRILYTILKYVNSSDMIDKKFYTNILRAQLSNSELHLLLYNGVSRQGYEKMKPLLEEYQFFDNLPFERVKYQDALKEYSKEAFGSNDKILAYLQV